MFTATHGCVYTNPRVCIHIRAATETIHSQPGTISQQNMVHKWPPDKNSEAESSSNTFITTFPYGPEMSNCLNQKSK